MPSELLSDARVVLPDVTAVVDELLATTVADVTSANGTSHQQDTAQTFPTFFSVDPKQATGKKMCFELPINIKFEGAARKIFIHENSFLKFSNILLVTKFSILLYLSIQIDVNKPFIVTIGAEGIFWNCNNDVHSRCWKCERMPSLVMI